MIDFGSVSSLIFFVASAGPGYVFLRTSDKREPRQTRTSLIEAAELLVIGTLITAVVLVLLATLGIQTQQFDSAALMANPLGYFLLEPVRVSLFLVIAVIVSHTAAWGTARLVHFGKRSSLRPDYTVWHQVFRSAAISGPVFVTIELVDGRRVGGYLHAYSVDRPEVPREVSLQRPIFAVGKITMTPLPLESDFLVISEGQISSIAVTRA